MSFGRQKFKVKSQKSRGKGQKGHYRLAVVALLFLGEILVGGCRSDGEKLHGFAAGFSRDFFRMFPDSAAIAGQKVAVGELLAAPDPVGFDEKRAFFERKRAELLAIRPEKLDAQEIRAHQFLLKKTENLLARMDGDLSLFDAGPALRFVAEKGGDRRGDLDILLKKIPAFYTAAKLDFTKKKGGNGARAIADGVETFRFLVKLKKDFPKNGDLDAAILAVKDWVAFCR